MDRWQEFIKDPKRLAVILDSLPVGVVVICADNMDIIYRNDFASELMGLGPQNGHFYTRDEVLSKYDVYDEKGRMITSGDGPAMQALRHKKSEMLLKYVPKSGGAVRWVVAKSIALADEQGRKHIVNVTQDITGLKQTELGLQEANKRITNILTGILE